MNRRIVRRGLVRCILVSCLGALIVMLGCEERVTIRREATGLRLTVVGYTGCKELHESESGRRLEMIFDCVAYRYDGSGTLFLDHINAGFNCCPGEIVADITIDGSTITISEGETESACDCLCLFDVHYRIDDLPPGTYTITFIEPYRRGEDEVLEFTVELDGTTSGSHCVERNHYPWDVDTTPDGPVGFVIGYTDCKGGPPPSDPFDITSDMDCIVYDYSWTGVLRLTHVNAGFNCCPGEIIADITISNDTITIVEGETESGCLCLCLFDVEYEIRNLPQGTYHLRIEELYVTASDEPLTCRIDLEAYPSCSFCVGRDSYPWSIGGSGTLEEDLERLRAMNEVITEYVGIPVCSGNGECDAFPFGAKPCGGPWRYLIFSHETVDADHLREMVCLYNAFNRVINHRHGIASDCSVVPPPRLGCRHGRCVDLNR
ncbi:MAG: hypothetical protein JSV33_05390 [bacterium]|nr:MAG: hypothetical protein JSV33_05390 [bacterium]